MRSIFISNIAGNLEKVYSTDTQSYLQEAAGLELTQYTRDRILETPEAFRDVDFIFSTWGMPAFTEEEIATFFPKLQCVFYGAGSVQSFARPFLNRGVKVFSAWAANAVPVAEYTLAQILLANKGYYYTSRLSSLGNAKESYKWKQHIPGNYDVTYPEPPVEGHPFYELPNCVITPHIAGSIGNEVHRMACYMAEEFRRYTAGEPTHYEVSLKMLETMA